jgi:hypothetical protein
MLHPPPPQWQETPQKGILQSPSGQSHPKMVVHSLPVNTRGTGEGAMLVALFSSAGEEGAMLVVLFSSDCAKAADVNRRR